MNASDTFASISGGYGEVAVELSDDGKWVRVNVGRNSSVHFDLPTAGYVAREIQRVVSSAASITVEVSDEA